tara:strand:- start:307 stop:498 length:192 start_codon:yes stop_codon:yes gene_type:complete
MKIIYTLFIITVHDYHTEEMELHRVDFSEKAECLFIAEMFNQKRDPVVRKPNCTKVITEELTE